MMLLSLTPSLMVPDVERSVNFYCETLNFTLMNTVPELPPYDFATLRWGPIELMFQSVQTLGDAVDFADTLITSPTVTLHVRVREVRNVLNRMRGRAQVLEPLHQTRNGTESFTIVDPNGYVVSFIEKTLASGPG